jgi:hypothetical protein
LINIYIKELVMESIKKKIIEWVITLTVACVCVFFMVNYVMKGSDGRVAMELQAHNENMKRIQYDIGNQQISLNMINEQLFELDTNQNKYIQAIKENTRWQQINYKQMQKLKDIYSEKINSANSYNYRQVDSFFSNRYLKFKKN